jgi:hypothetical protein
MRRVIPLAALGFGLPALAYADCAITAPPIAATGRFTSANGQIYDQNGKPFIAKGINLMQGQEGDLSQIIATLPGINFIRFNVLDLSVPASAYQGFVQQAAAAGIFVLFDDHTNNGNNGSAGGEAGTIFQGQQLQNELNWFHNAAITYAAYANVGLDSNNEPSEKLTPNGPNDPAALSAWQDETYHAIRDGTGFTGPVVLQVNGDATPANFGAGYNTALWAGYTNTWAEIHDYAWVPGFNADQNAITQNLLANIGYTQHLTTANGAPPVLIGEYGPSTTGNYPGDDPNGYQLVASVLSAGVSSAAWGWRTGAFDNLANRDGSLTPFGQMVQTYFKSTVCPGVIPYIPVPANVPHVLPQTYVPPIAGLPPELLAPEPPPRDDIPPATETPGVPVLPPNLRAPTPTLLAPPLPTITAPPLPGPRQPPIFAAPAINTQYPALPTVTPTLPDLPPDAPPMAVQIDQQLKTVIGEIGMISPIGTFLVRMDASVVTATTTALQGMAPMLTIPVTALAVLFLAARGVRISQSDNGSWGAIWFDLVKIAMVFWLALNTANYQAWVLTMVYTTIPNQLTGAVMAGTGAATGVTAGVQGTAAAFDSVYNKTWELVSTTWSHAGLVDFGTKISAEFCGIGIALALMAMAGVYLLARVMLALILVFGPICIAASMHPQSAPIFARWAGKCFALICMQVMAVIILVMLMTANQEFMAQINPVLVQAPAAANNWVSVDGAPAPSMAGDLQALTAMIAWFGMAAFLLYALPALAYSLGTGVATSFTPLMVAMGAAANAVGGAISAAAGGMGGGFSFGGGGGGSGLSMELAREEIEGAWSGAALPPPAPPSLSSATPPALGAP